jgi:hypothetical protein
MTYILLSDLSTKQQTCTVKVKVMRLSESINNRTGELMSLDMILMDQKVFFILFYTTVQLLYTLAFTNKIFFWSEQCNPLYNMEEYV